MDSSSPLNGCVLESQELRSLAGDEAVNVLKCSICWEFYNDPVILACGHTFCFKCLVQMAKYAKQYNYRMPVHTIFIGCPNCRRPIYISAILSHRLTHNYPLASFMESLKHRRVKKAKTVTKETNTEPPEPSKPEKEREDIDEESRRRRTLDDTDEHGLNMLTTNLDIVLRTLASTGSVLGDFSCAEDIQEIVHDFQHNSENRPQGQSQPRGRHRNAHRPDPAIDELCSSFERADFSSDREGGDVGQQSAQTQESGQDTDIPDSAQYGIPETDFQDPAILSFAIDSQFHSANRPRNEQFLPFGLYRFPGFGQI